MTSQDQKKISVPSEELLKHEKYKKRKSRLFLNMNDDYEIPSSSIEKEIYQKYHSVIKGNLFDNCNQLTDKAENELPDKQDNNEDIITKKLITDDEEDDFDILNIPSSRMLNNISPFSMLKAKAKKMNYSQKLSQEILNSKTSILSNQSNPQDNYFYLKDDFQIKRSTIKY